ncbi:hypothetical protein ACQKWADRAFT_4579 [Trichoderma austrokoningii]
MSNLPSQHPTLSLHLTDLTLTPLITSSSSQSHLESLTKLTSSAITSQTTAQRANLGRPQRIMVEYPDSGAVVLQSYLDPRESSSGSHSSAEPDSFAKFKYKDEHEDEHVIHDDDRSSNSSSTRTLDTARPVLDDSVAPALISVVVAATSDDAREARRAAARLERIGREFQREWTAQGLEQDAEGGSGNDPE